MGIMRRTHDVTPRGWLFFCPGCRIHHEVRDSWTFNGNESAPTFTPSVLVTWNEGVEQTPKRCHLFVRDGELVFLDDSSHHLAGRTVPMEPLR